LISVFIGFLVFPLSLPGFGDAQDHRKILVSNATLSYSALPLVAAREWKCGRRDGLEWWSDGVME